MICSQCNYDTLIPIWYGTPTVTEILLAQADQIVLGGPVEKPYTHFCGFCQVTYPARED